ncbi:MAG: response regulator [Planctomycetota bacterium]
MTTAQGGNSAMLVISRKNDETVQFPDLGIEVRVVKTGASKVRLGIDAPSDIAIVRGELPRHETPKLMGEENASSIRRRVVLVEDNLNEARLLTSYLKLKDVDVEVAGNGAEALETLESGPLPDAVLLDMQMPKFDGCWTIRQLRKHPTFSSLQVIAVTGSNPNEIGVTIGAGGVDSWFPKPLNPEHLYAHLFSKRVALA